LVPEEGVEYDTPPPGRFCVQIVKLVPRTELESEQDEVTDAADSGGAAAADERSERRRRRGA
jgi:hypothetical protein